MRSILLVVASVCTASLFLSMPANAESTGIKAKVVLTDSTTAPLAATKRVAITSVIVSFQTSTEKKTNTNGLLASKTDASTTLQMPDPDPVLLEQITDDIYAQLKTDLTDRGFEVLPESTVVSSPTYQKIIQEAGFTNVSKFANLNGDVILVGASGLKPYMPYAPEVGKFSVTPNSHIKGWMKTFGASSTEGGPSGIKMGKNYGLPGLEVALAKELDATLVKATYVVTLGSTSAAVDRFSSTSHNNYSGNAFAQVGLRAEQTRIAFRTAAARSKGESVNTYSFGEKSPPAKDGNVVVTLAESLAGGTDFFTVKEPDTKKPSLLGALLGGSVGGADVQFIFTASISDPAAYRAETVGMMKAAQRDMLNLVKP